jgi:MPBQ/MSBQ methyltransferase
MGQGHQDDRQHSLKDVIQYYLDTGLDYGEWSREYNMHFGFFKFGMNPFRRERMLDEMNQQVFTHLQLSPEDKIVYDLGCGLGAPCRAFARRFADKKIIGVTIVPWQVEKAKLLNEEAGLETRIEMVLGDYTKLPVADNSVDGVFALESCCHCEGLDKAAFIKEMLRVLKPGKRFVIVDGFIKKDPVTFRFVLRYCYQQIIKGWALPSFPHIDLLSEAIRNEGGENIEVKDFSFRVAPSVMHSPFTVLYFLIKKTLQGEKLNPVRLGHLKACLLGLVLGMHRRKFAYCMVTGTKQ